MIGTFFLKIIQLYYIESHPFRQQNFPISWQLIYSAEKKKIKLCILWVEKKRKNWYLLCRIKILRIAEK